LPDEIKRLGGRCDVCPAYKTIRPRKEAGALKERLASGQIEMVTFTSSSTVTNFAKNFTKAELNKLMAGVKVACIGPITADTARGLGLNVDVMPDKYTVPALAEAMAEYYRGR